MSKGSLFWGNASGKLGETVFYRSGGEQRNRTYLAKIKNPKTYAQMINRISMRNLSAVYRALLPIISDGWPNRKSNQTAFNAFTSFNKSANTAVLPVEAMAQGLSVPVNMTLTNGGLAIPVNLIYRMLSTAEGGGYGFVSDIVGPAVSQATPVTSAALIADTFLLGAENPYSLPSNIKLTIVRAVRNGNGYSVSYKQIETGVGDTRTFDNWELALIPNEDGKSRLAVYVTPTADAPENGLLAALIISYTDADGVLKVTTSRMVYSDGDSETAGVNDFLPGGSVWVSVLEEYGFSADTYLSTASNTNVANAPSGGGSDGSGDGSGFESLSIEQVLFNETDITSGDFGASTVKGDAGTTFALTMYGTSMDDAAEIKVLVNGTECAVTIDDRDETFLALTVERAANVVAYEAVTLVVNINGNEVFSKRFASDESNPDYPV